MCGTDPVDRTTRRRCARASGGSAAVTAGLGASLSAMGGRADVAPASVASSIRHLWTMRTPGLGLPGPSLPMAYAFSCPSAPSAIQSWISSDLVLGPGTAARRAASGSRTAVRRRLFDTGCCRTARIVDDDVRPRELWPPALAGWSAELRSRPVIWSRGPAPAAVGMVAAAARPSAALKHRPDLGSRNVTRRRRELESALLQVAGQRAARRRARCRAQPASPAARLTPRPRTINDGFMAAPGSELQRQHREHRLVVEARDQSATLVAWIDPCSPRDRTAGSSRLDGVHRVDARALGLDVRPPSMSGVYRVIMVPWPAAARPGSSPGRSAGAASNARSSGAAQEADLAASCRHASWPYCRPLGRSSSNMPAIRASRRRSASPWPAYGDRRAVPPTWRSGPGTLSAGAVAGISTTDRRWSRTSRARRRRLDHLAELDRVGERRRRRDQALAVGSAARGTRGAGSSARRCSARIARQRVDQRVLADPAAARCRARRSELVERRRRRASSLPERSSSCTSLRRQRTRRSAAGRTLCRRASTRGRRCRRCRFDPAS